LKEQLSRTDEHESYTLKRTLRRHSYPTRLSVASLPFDAKETAAY
jgi:hypothetical protein